MLLVEMIAFLRMDTTYYRVFCDSIPRNHKKCGTGRIQTGLAVIVAKSLQDKDSVCGSPDKRKLPGHSSARLSVEEWFESPP